MDPLKFINLRDRDVIQGYLELLIDNRESSTLLDKITVESIKDKPIYALLAVLEDNIDKFDKSVYQRARDVLGYLRLEIKHRFKFESAVRFLIRPSGPTWRQLSKEIEHVTNELFYSYTYRKTLKKEYKKHSKIIKVDGLKTMLMIFCKKLGIGFMKYVSEIITPIVLEPGNAFDYVGAWKTYVYFRGEQAKIAPSPNKDVKSGDSLASEDELSSISSTEVSEESGGESDYGSKRGPGKRNGDWEVIVSSEMTEESDDELEQPKVVVKNKLRWFGEDFESDELDDLLDEM